MQTVYTQLVLEVNETERITLDINHEGIRFTLVRIENSVAYEKDWASMKVENTKLVLNKGSQPNYSALLAEIK